MRYRKGLQSGSAGGREISVLYVHSRYELFLFFGCFLHAPSSEINEVVPSKSMTEIYGEKAVTGPTAYSTTSDMV